MWWHLEIGFREIIRVRWDRKSRAPMIGLVPLKKRYETLMSPYICTKRRSCAQTARLQPPTSQGERPQNENWHLDLGLPSLQKRTNLCWISHPMHNILLCQPEQIETNNNHCSDLWEHTLFFLGFYIYITRITRCTFCIFGFLPWYNEKFIHIYQNKEMLFVFLVYRKISFFLSFF